MTLDVYTWDQAEIIRAWPPPSFAAVGINPATIRKWASRGDITAVGQGPNGSRLYLYDDVIRHAGRNTSSSLALEGNTCHTDGTCGEGMSA